MYSFQPLSTIVYADGKGSKYRELLLIMLQNYQQQTRELELSSQKVKDLIWRKIPVPINMNVVSGLVIEKHFSKSCD